MTISSSFGFASRHRIYYNRTTRSGTVTLWSYYTGPSAGPDPIDRSRKFLYQCFPTRMANQDSLLGSTYYVDLPIGDDKDVLSLFASLELVKNGSESAFSNYIDQRISFTWNKEAGIILVKVGSNEKTGKLVINEINPLEAYLKEILLEFGYSKTEIAEKVTDRITVISLDSKSA